MMELLGFIGLGLLALVGIYLYAVVQNKLYIDRYVFQIKNVNGIIEVGVCQFPKSLSYLIAPFFPRYTS